MITRLLRAARMQILKRKRLHAMLRRCGVIPVGRRIYDSLLLRKGSLCVSYFGEAFLLAVHSREELKRIDYFVNAEREFVTRLRGAIRRDDSVIDVGANIGLITLLAARLVTEGTVVALEPEPANARDLAENVSRNGLASRVRIAEFAAGASNGIARLWIAGEAGSGANSILARKTTAGTFVEVPMITLDACCERADIVPAVIKIDVEGAEVEVLRGAKALLSRRVPRDIFVEVHPSELSSVGSCASDVAAILTGHGYRRMWQAQRGGQIHEHYQRS